MSDKVKLPKEVAEAISNAKELGFTTADIITRCFEVEDKGPFRNAIRDYAADNFDLFLQALVNGYEVERNPEEHLLQMFKEACQKEIVGNNEDWWQGRRMGIIDTLNTLGIKIKGINP